jgi:hypothetical protein
MPYAIRGPVCALEIDNGAEDLVLQALQLPTQSWLVSLFLADSLPRERCVIVAVA